MKHQKKFLLSEQDLPTQWYNIQAEMPNKPMPPLNPKTHEPLTAEDLSHIFNMECSKQELDQTHPWIDIPEEVQEKYAYYRALHWCVPTLSNKPSAHVLTYISKREHEPVGIPQDQFRPASMLLLQGGRRHQCHHGNRSRTVGSSPFIRSKTLRT